MKIVMKFGGSSLADALRIENCARIVEKYHGENHVVVVVSAIADVTDRLIEIGEEAQKGHLAKAKKLASVLTSFHLRSAERVSAKTAKRKELLALLKRSFNDLQRTIEGIAQFRELTPRTRDYLLSTGERLSGPIVKAALQKLDLNSLFLTGGEAGIITDNNHGEARPLIETSFHQIMQRIEPLLSRGVVPVIAGFLAQTVDGIITTLGRGGSDYTATLLAAALEADEVWIWTDVDGLMTADPRTVENAQILRRVSFEEALELSYFGAKMMHPRALHPAAQKKIPVRIKNASKPEGEGTLIAEGEGRNRGKAVRAVSMIPDVGIVTVSGSEMIGAPGVAAKVFQTLGSNGVNVMMISQGSSEATISSAVASRDVDKAVRALQLSLMKGGYVEGVFAEKDVCIIAVVGSGMKGTPGVAANIFGAVAKRGINVRMIAQGSSEYNVSFVVSRNHGPRAVRAIHETFGLGT